MSINADSSAYKADFYFSPSFARVFFARAEGDATNGHLNLLLVFSAGAQLPPFSLSLTSALSAVVACSVCWLCPRTVLSHSDKVVVNQHSARPPPAAQPRAAGRQFTT